MALKNCHIRIYTAGIGTGNPTNPSSVYADSNFVPYFWAIEFMAVPLSFKWPWFIDPTVGTINTK